MLPWNVSVPFKLKELKTPILLSENVDLPWRQLTDVDLLAQAVSAFSSSIFLMGFNCHHIELLAVQEMGQEALSSSFWHIQRNIFSGLKITKANSKISRKSEV